ncbi:hypothetical protein [Proteiniphilum sp. X52]|uniref:tetratricopeptide repeat protein n=1 Tax=Proteiniphilum sp. X52 TaxID=2382159 RepID=UPI000F4105C2|nr:hypothetical protein [Proteiniphilum sp. X52]RNC63884.1 hypothetical protein D7D25_14335 [Proteiniphilum sp. X52]
MKTALYASCILLLGIITICCDDSQSHASILLVKAEQLMNDHPDKAMVLIDSILYPERSFNDEDYMRYCVVRVQARYKNYLPINEDTLIFKARDYFTMRAKKNELAALASFYSGCVYREQGNLNQAMLNYKDAGTFAALTNDTALKGLIMYNTGELLSEHGLYAKALYNYQQAKNFYGQFPEDMKNQQTHCFSAIGQMFMLLGEQDSAFIYFFRGLEIAESINDRQLQSLLAQNLSVAYSETNQNKEAGEFLHRSIRLSLNDNDLPHYYLNLSKLYRDTGQLDSLAFFINKLKQTVDTSTDLYFKASAYNLLAGDAKTNHRYEMAFDYQQKRNEIVEKINEERFQQSIYEVQQKYDYIKQRNLYDLLLLQRQRIIIIILSLFLLLSLLSVFLLRQVVRQKNQMISLQNAMQTLNKTTNDLQKRETSVSRHEKQLRETLLWKFNVLLKSFLLKSELEPFEMMDTKITMAKFEEIVYGKNNRSLWNSLVEIIDELYPGLSHFIRNSYPQFSDTELKVCLLSYAGLPSKIIAPLINQSVNTVNMSRTRIRQKMGLQKPGADFCLFLKHLYDKNRGLRVLKHLN